MYTWLLQYVGTTQALYRVRHTYHTVLPFSYKCNPPLPPRFGNNKNKSTLESTFFKHADLCKLRNVVIPTNINTGVDLEKAPEAIMCTLCI